MAFTPISNTVPQYEENGIAASGFYIKFYEAGTTTPTAMATDSTGATLLDKCELNTEGYPKNGSNAVFIPHIDKKYKIALFRNATDADNNNLNNAVWSVDNLSPFITDDSVIQTQIDTIALLKLFEPVEDGQQISLLGHTTPGFGGDVFYYDNLDTSTSDDNIVTIVTAGGKRWKRKDVTTINPYMAGAIDLRTTDQSAYINLAFNTAKTLGVACDLLGKEWRIDNTLLFRNGVVVRGNDCLILNYSGTHACMPHPDDINVRSEVSDVFVTYENYNSSLNPNSPPYTIDKAQPLGRQLKFTHLDTFTGSGWHYSSTGSGGGFKNLVHCRARFHKTGFYLLGPSPRLRFCLGVSCEDGLRGDAVPEVGVFNPPHSAVIDGCVFSGNLNSGQSWRYVDGLRIEGGSAEKNYNSNLNLEGVRGSTGHIYTEYGEYSITMLLCEGIDISAYSAGNKSAFVPFAQGAGAYYTETLAGGNDFITVSGIADFETMPASDVAIVRNHKYYTAWTKAGSVITLTGSFADGDDIEVIANAFLDPVTDTTAVLDKYELGSLYPLRVQHSQSISFNGYANNFINGTVNVNDFDAGLADTNNISFTAILKGTTKTLGSEIFYSWQDGFLNKQEFFKGLSIKNSLDSNVNVSQTAFQDYPGLGASLIVLGADAHRAVWMIVSGHGSATFTVDTSGNIYTGSVNTQQLTLQNTNAAEAGKINIYKNSATSLNVDNQLFSSQLTIMKISA